MRHPRHTKQRPGRTRPISLDSAAPFINALPCLQRPSVYKFDDTWTSAARKSAEDLQRPRWRTGSPETAIAESALALISTNNRSPGCEVLDALTPSVN